MYKLKASITKEILLLLNDKVGLFFMFFMPILLVFIITIIQNSAYEIINENKISMVISNQDEGFLGDSLVKLLDQSKMFDLSNNEATEAKELSNLMLENKTLTAVFIPKGFSKYIENKSANSTELMLFQMGLAESKPIYVKQNLDLDFFYDPVLQENYIKSIEGILFQTISILENTNFIKEIYSQIGVENQSEDLTQNIFADKINIQTQHASLNDSKSSKKPNATQHNVPAWTIFAMFFMVVSLASNIVKEKNNGSFVRLKTMPTSILTSLISKMFVFIFASFLQVIVIFSIGKFIFPYIGLPALNFGGHWFSFFLVVLITSLAAVSWALFIGVYAKTQEQAGGIGAISIIIFAAIGGVWVPTFAMPAFMQTLSKLSPMNWSLEGFYTLFLKNGNIKELFFTFVVLTAFIFIMQTLSFLKLKKDKLL